MVLFLRFFVLLCVSIAFITASYGQDYNAIRQESEKACDLGHAGGCLNLGNSCANGRGVKQDYIQANTLYTKAWDLGEQKGCDGYKILNQ